MKVRFRLMLGALAAGVVLGGIGVSVLHTQTRPSAFYVAGHREAPLTLASVC
ncbi:hypothetical protein V1290_000663 [Bradyrhizobium sp. AZCC 1578]